MVNTWTPNCTEKLSGQWNTPSNLLGPINFSYERTNVTTGEDISIGSIPIVLKYKNEILDISGKKDIEKVGSAPFKLCLPVGTRWPIERVNIVDAYPDFKEYVKNSSVNFTQNADPKNKGLLYTGRNSSIEIDGMGIGDDDNTKGDAEPQNWTVVWKGNVTQSETYLELFDYNFEIGETLRIFGTGSFDVSANNQNIFSCSISGGYCDIPITNRIKDDLKKILTITGSNFTLTKIVVLKK